MAGITFDAAQAVAEFKEDGLVLRFRPCGEKVKLAHSVSVAHVYEVPGFRKFVDRNGVREVELDWTVLTPEQTLLLITSWNRLMAESLLSISGITDPEGRAVELTDLAPEHKAALVQQLRETVPAFDAWANCWIGGSKKKSG